MLHVCAMFSEIERDLCSERVKDGLHARKLQGVRLGRPKGSSKLDGQDEKIRELLELKIPKKYIAETVGCSVPTLKRFIDRQKHGGNNSAKEKTKAKIKRPRK